MVEYQTEGSELTVGTSTVEFEAPIHESVLVEDLVVVLLEWTHLETPTKFRNVVGVQFDGSLRWRVEEVPDTGDGDPQPYSGISVRDDGLWAYDLIGMMYKVDQTDGTILEEYFAR